MGAIYIMRAANNIGKVKIIRKKKKNSFKLSILHMKLFPSHYRIVNRQSFSTYKQ